MRVSHEGLQVSGWDEVQRCARLNVRASALEGWKVESIVYVIIASVKSSEIHSLTLKRANNAIVRSTISFAREMMIDLRLKRPNQCL